MDELERAVKKKEAQGPRNFIQRMEDAKKADKDIDKIIHRELRLTEINVAAINALHEIKPYYYPSASVVRGYDSCWPDTAEEYSAWQGHKVEARFSERCPPDAIAYMTELLAPYGCVVENHGKWDYGTKTVIVGRGFANPELTQRLATEFQEEVAAPDFPKNLGNRRPAAPACEPGK
ncbi:MAG: hypothetical protein PHE27_01425 [Alphaproteobacteria bacterium]|nr:hypothetical protein [Alphaproteobacteria bacterium]